MRRSAAAFALTTALLVPGRGLAEAPSGGPVPPAASDGVVAAASPPTTPVGSAGTPAPSAPPSATGGAAPPGPPAADGATSSGIESRREPTPETASADPGGAGANPGAAQAAAAAVVVPIAAPDPSAAAAAAAAVQLPLPPPPPPSSTAAAPATVGAAPELPGRKPWRTLPLVGLSLGAGFPDLVNANLLVRPINWVRVYGGPCWSSLSWGVQGGVVLSPINWYVTPTLSFQAGKLFRTNASRYVRDETRDGTTTSLKPLLARVDYHYYAGDLGLELGSPRGFNFFLRFGLSFFVLKANGTGTASEDDGAVVRITNPKISAWAPSAKLGFQYWF